MATSRLSRKRQKVFRSVFDTDISQPTPYATPTARFTELGQAFGGPLQPGQTSLEQHHLKAQSSQITDQARWDRSWHTVTTKVQLPPSVAAEDSFGLLAPEQRELDLEFYESLKVVLFPSRHVPHAAHTEDILVWHTQQVRRHLAQHVFPLLSAFDSARNEMEILEGSMRTLEAAHRQYLYGLQLILRGMEEKEAGGALAMFRRDLHAVIGNSMSPTLITSLRNVLSRYMRLLLETQPSSSGQSQSPGMRETSQTAGYRRDLRTLVDGLQKAGLAGEKFEILFAELMDSFMIERILISFLGTWKQHQVGENLNRSSSIRRGGRTTTQSERIAALYDWIENTYARLAVEVFSRLEGTIVPWRDVEKWKEIAVGRLAVLRIHELFDIVLQWPESRDALEDLRMAVTTPQRRLQLTDAFSAALQKRLLHSGRSTLDILQVYISMIRTFHALDPSKVLLDRVVYSLQLYLCQRDDAIRIVVTGLLSDADDAKADTEKTRLAELAVLLNDPSQQRRQTTEDDELDWHDMNWVPDPVDAGVNYKRPKSEDVIGTLINALGSQDIFIKEFQSIIAERLLSKQAGFMQEIKVLNLLKKKFGENALQNCDVMMKDIQDSKRVDDVINRNIEALGNDEPGPRSQDAPSYHSKILSRLFWPTLDREHFLLPQPLVDIQSRYETEFEHLKSSRKLTWLNNLGTATVYLELEDRTVDKQCKTYEAVVIYAFQDDGNASDPARRTVDELYMTLQMDDDMIRLALGFWVSQRVLRQVEPDTYAVLERLDDTGTDNAPPPLDLPPHENASPAKPGKGGMDAQEKERRQVYWQFIVGMLTNSAPAMPLGQMAMMMKMLIVDGFVWSNEELQEFLGEKIAEGDLELAGGKYKLPKK